MRRTLITIAVGLALLTGQPVAPEAQEEMRAEGGMTIRLGDQVAQWFVQTAILLARSVADIRYTDIVIDPRLQVVNVLGLSIDTDQFSLTAAELSLSTSSFDLFTLMPETPFTVALRGVTVPIGQTALPPALEPFLSPRGDGLLVGDVELQLSSDLASSRLVVLATTLVADIGRVDLETEVSGIRFDLETEEPRGWLERAAVRLRDGGGVAHVLGLLADQQGVEPAQMRQFILEAIGQQATAFFADPARAGEVVTALATFLEGGHSLNVLVRPDEPLPFAALPALVQGGAAAELGLAVLADDAGGLGIPSLPELDPTSPPEVLAAAAAAYAEGVGVPQNFGRALELSDRAARAGDPQAMVLQARLLTDLAADPDRRAEAYRLASLAAAAGELDGAALVARLESAMPAEQVAEAQADAVRLWREAGPGPDLLDTEAAARTGNVGAMRDLAQAFLAGTGAPKSYEEAYVWASLAAARGDMLAAAMRERVVGAARRGVISTRVLEDAQARAAELWEELPPP